MIKAVWAALVVLGLIAGFGGGCSDDNGPASQGAGGTANDASASWSQHACHSCFAGRCSQEIAACQANPTCAVFGECVEACPADAAGTPSADCVQRCPGTSTSSEYAACLSRSQAECFECGGAAPDAARADGGTCPAGLACQECAVSTETNPCWKCQDERCCETDQACNDDQGCLDYFHCFQACGGLGGCTAICDASVGPEHFLKFNSKASCILIRCIGPTKCGNTQVDPCLGCVFVECASEKASCDTNDQCARMSLCVEDCRDQGCYDACFGQFSSGLELFNELSACTLAHCEDVCSN